MRIVIDARLFGTRHTGIGRYSQNLVEELSKKVSVHKLILITHHQAEISSTKNLQVVKTDIPYYGLSEQFRLIRLIDTLKPDLVHFTHFNHPVLYNLPFVVTIHDLIKSDYKDHSASTRNKAFYEFKHLVYTKVVTHAVKKSKVIITPSEYTKSRVINYYPKIDPSKIITIYEGADQFQALSRQKLLEHKNTSILAPFCLYVGNSYPYKNLLVAIEAVKKIPGLQLVVVSRNNPSLAGLKSQALNKKKFVFLENLSDRELASLYHQSKFFLFPSLCEGFGVPGLEAMAMQTPLISSNAGPLTEIYGKAAIYFDPNSTEDLVRQINFLLSNYLVQKKELNKSAAFQLKKYSWQKTAEETLKVYESCLSI